MTNITQILLFNGLKHLSHLKAPCQTSPRETDLKIQNLRRRKQALHLNSSRPTSPQKTDFCPFKMAKNLTLHSTDDRKSVIRKLTLATIYPKHATHLLLVLWSTRLFSCAILMENFLTKESFSPEGNNSNFLDVPN